MSINSFKQQQVNFENFPVVHSCLKGKYHANLLSFQNPKMFVCQQKQQNNNFVKFVINYHPSAIKLSISASGQRQSRLVWIET